MKTTAFLSSVLCAAALLSNCATIPSTPAALGNSSSLAGTSWVGLTQLEEGMNFDFHAGGMLKDGANSGTWQQQGNSVTMTMNNAYATYTGTVSGNTMNGTARNVAGRTWTWSVNRTPQ